MVLVKRSSGKYLKASKSRGSTAMLKKMPMIVYSSCTPQSPYTRKSGGRTLHRLRVLGTENDCGLHLMHPPSPSSHALPTRVFSLPLSASSCSCRFGFNSFHLIYYTPLLILSSLFFVAQLCSFLFYMNSCCG